MKLAQKRAIETIQNEFEIWRKALNTEYPKINFSIDWDEMGRIDEIERVASGRTLTLLILDRIKTALSDLTIDDAGREAISTQLSRIHIVPKNGDRIYSNGTLILESSPVMGQGAWDAL